MEKGVPVIGSRLLLRFGNFELDPARFELRAAGEVRHIEPQVFSLLMLLASNADRLVGKDEVIKEIWGGRIVSEAAVASRVKAARQALGDDGKRQTYIRTVHGKGFLFVAPVAFDDADGRASVPTNLRHSQVRTAADPEERPSIAVLPFQVTGEPGPLAFIGDALADELIVGLSRLRWLLVIARSSTFRLRDPNIPCEAIGSVLKARYCLTGTVEQRRDHFIMSVELAHTADRRLVWAERFTAGHAELQGLRSEMLAAIVAALDVRVLQHEVELARQTPEAALGPWSSYHLGLDHMFQFSRSANRKAASLFERALAVDPHFSRALSGLSFTCFQDCFLGYSDRRDENADRARSLAVQALRCDPLDPFAHLNLGRSHWLDGAVQQSIDILSECIALSPNYAHAIYSKAWAEMTQHDTRSSDENATLALRLSPIDPLRYAMLAVRSVSAFLRGDYASATEWGEKAARSPGAHKHIAVIAALVSHASGDKARARSWVAHARHFDPDITRAGFFASFPFAHSPKRERIERGLRDLGL